MITGIAIKQQPVDIQPIAMDVSQLSSALMNQGISSMTIETPQSDDMQEYLDNAANDLAGGKEKPEDVINELVFNMRKLIAIDCPISLPENTEPVMTPAAEVNNGL